MDFDSTHDDFESRAYRPLTALLAGCILATISAFITGALLLLNGGIVLMTLNQSSGDFPIWMRKPEVLQFLLFFLPLVLVVTEWIAWDAFRWLIGNLLRRFRKYEYSPQNW